MAVLFDFLAVFLICCVEQYFLGSSWSGDPVRIRIPGFPDPDPVSGFSGVKFLTSIGGQMGASVREILADFF
jgi:hypothetical protein